MLFQSSRNLARGWGLAATLAASVLFFSFSVPACSGAGSASTGDGATALSTAPDGGSPAFDAYADLAVRHGVTSPAHDRALVIGIRGQGASGANHPTVVRHAFDDRMVVLLPDRRVVTFSMSTHPFETGAPASDGVPDVDHDGVPDVGMILPGFYSAERRGAEQNIVGETTYHVLTRAGSDHIPGIRNTNHDDSFSAAERQSSEGRHDTQTAILFHVGEGAGAPLVIGCQVLAAPDMHALAAFGGASFDYLLVDANDETVPPVP